MEEHNVLFSKNSKIGQKIVEEPGENRSRFLSEILSELWSFFVLNSVAISLALMPQTKPESILKISNNKPFSGRQTKNHKRIFMFLRKMTLLCKWLGAKINLCNKFYKGLF